MVMFQLSAPTVGPRSALNSGLMLLLTRLLSRILVYWDPYKNHED